MNTLLKQPSYKMIENKVKDDYASHHYKKGVGGLDGAIKDQYGNC